MPECKTGGRGEIRTLGTLAGSVAFEATALNHSATPPICLTFRHLAEAAYYRAATSSLTLTLGCFDRGAEPSCPVRRFISSMCARNASRDTFLTSGIPISSFITIVWRRGRDSNPRDPFGSTVLAGQRHRPLGHLSRTQKTRLVGGFKRSRSNFKILKSP